MVDRVHEDVQVCVYRRAAEDEEYVVHCHAVADRFEGSLKRAVPRATMYQKFGVDRNGWKVVLPWTQDAETADWIVEGDVLELGEERLPICGVEQRPGVYVEVYACDPAPAPSEAHTHGSGIVGRIFHRSHHDQT